MMRGFVFTSQCISVSQLIATVVASALCTLVCLYIYTSFGKATPEF